MVGTGGGVMTVSLEAVALEKPEDVNVIIGQAHFIKTVEDLHEALPGSVSMCASASPSVRPRAPV
jgi:adenosine/AMP kinase